jgi:hypothetical protein
VDQAILVDADIDEGAEIDDVPDGAVENHPRLEVFDVFHGSKGRRYGLLRADRGLASATR